MVSGSFLGIQPRHFAEYRPMLLTVHCNSDGRFDYQVIGRPYGITDYFDSQSDHSSWDALSSVQLRVGPYIMWCIVAYYARPTY